MSLTTGAHNIEYFLFLRRC